MTVIVSKEQERGCGFRKPSASGVGIYLVGGALSAPCGKLPMQLDVCPTCHAGIKPSRGWTWIVPSTLLAHVPPCKLVEPPPVPASSKKKAPVLAPPVPAACMMCPVGTPPPGRHGLLWIGEKFYDSPQAFTREAARMGVSRKISAIPKGFQLGETWVYLAHRYAFQGDDNKMAAGVFSVFKPTGVDLVVADENDVPERATRLAEELGDGARIIRVERDEPQQLSLPTVAQT